MLATGWRTLGVSSIAFLLLLLSSTFAAAAAARDGQMAYLGYAEMGGVRRAIIRNIGPGLLKLLAVGERLDEDCVVSAIGEEEVELQCGQGPSHVIIPLAVAGPSPSPHVDRGDVTAFDFSGRDPAEGGARGGEVSIQPGAVRPEAESSGDVSRIGMSSQAEVPRGELGQGAGPSGGGWMGGATHSGSSIALPEGVSGGATASGTMSREEILRLFEQGRARAPKEEP